MTEMTPELNAALAAAQGEFPTITKSKEVKTGTYSYTYAPLEVILDQCRPVLSKHGLAITQLLENGEQGPGIRTELRHAAGGVIGSSFPLPTLPAKAQELGSLLTYLRRYAIVALLGIVAEDDDDGAQATAAKQEKGRKKPAAAARSQPPPVPATPDDDEERGLLDGPILKNQQDMLKKLFPKKKITDKKEMASFAIAVIGREIASSNDLTFDEARQVISKLELYDPDDPYTWPV